MWVIWRHGRIHCDKRVPFASVSPPVLPVPGVVHHHVHPRPLQQLLLRCPPAGHRHGLQDPTHHPLVRHAQRQAGEDGEDAGLPCEQQGSLQRHLSGSDLLPFKHSFMFNREPHLFLMAFGVILVSNLVVTPHLSVPTSKYSASPRKINERNEA